MRGKFTLRDQAIESRHHSEVPASCQRVKNRHPPKSTQDRTLFPYTTLFRSLGADLTGYPSGQREQTVNLPAHAFEGSNPSPTMRRSEEHTSELQSHGLIS